MAGVTKVHDALKSKQDEVDHEIAEFIPKRIAKKVQLVFWRYTQFQAQHEIIVAAKKNDEHAKTWKTEVKELKEAIADAKKSLNVQIIEFNKKD